MRHRYSTLAVLVVIAGILASCARTPPDALPVVVTVSPPSAVLEPGETMDFSASVTGAASAAVTWTATCGVIDATGRYTAPATEGECQITATSVAAPQASGSAVVTVQIAAHQVTSTTDFSAPVDTFDLGPGETAWIQVNVPPAQRGSDRRLVVEARDDEDSRQLDLVLYEPDGTTPTASTSGRAFFQPGLDGIGEGFIGAASVDRSVVVVGNCLGPCISRRAESLEYVYVEITNVSASAKAVPFYAVTEPFIDEGEPQNDSPGGAVEVSVLSPYQGALEHIDDVDWVIFGQDGGVTLTERDGYALNVIMTLFDSGGEEIDTYVAGGSPIGVLAGDFGAIRSDPNDPRASVYGFYDVEYLGGE
jgi:hypothetical protein